MKAASALLGPIGQNGGELFRHEFLDQGRCYSSLNEVFDTRKCLYEYLEEVTAYGERVTLVASGQGVSNEEAAQLAA